MQAHEAQLERLKKALNTESDTAFSQVLEVSQGSVSGAKKRAQIPHSWFFYVSEKTGVSIDWLFFGTGPMRHGEATEPHVQPIQAPQAAPAEQGTTCKGCLKLVEKLIVVEEERQRISTAFVEALQKNLAFVEENGQLRLENLKLTFNLDTARQMCKEYAAKLEAADPSLFVKPQTIPSSETANLK